MGEIHNRIFSPFQKRYGKNKELNCRKIVIIEMYSRFFTIYVIKPTLSKIGIGDAKTWPAVLSSKISLQWPIHFF